MLVLNIMVEKSKLSKYVNNKSCDPNFYSDHKSKSNVLKKNI